MHEWPRDPLPELNNLNPDFVDAEEKTVDVVITPEREERLRELIESSLNFHDLFTKIAEVQQTDSAFCPKAMFDVILRIFERQDPNNPRAVKDAPSTLFAMLTRKYGLRATVMRLVEEMVTR